MLDFIEKEIITQKLNVYGIEIHKSGQLIYKLNLAEDIRYPIYSATKTITSAAFGIARSEGKISEEDFLADYIDTKYINLLEPKQRDHFKKLKLKRFLTMSVQGFPFRPSGDDWIEYSLLSNEDYSKPPVFSYSNVTAFLVGAACENAVNMPLYDYLDQKLFAPLEIDKPEYQTSPAGGFNGATGMKLTVDELSRIGRLYLNGGTFKGHRILPEVWVKDTVLKRIDNEEGGYGYFVWVNPDCFRISGKWGQKSLVYPNKDLVVTYLSNLPDNEEKLFNIAKRAVELL